MLSLEKHTAHRSAAAAAMQDISNVPPAAAPAMIKALTLGEAVSRLKTELGFGAPPSFCLLMPAGQVPTTPCE